MALWGLSGPETDTATPGPRVSRALELLPVVTPSTSPENSVLAITTKCSQKKKKKEEEEEQKKKKEEKEEKKKKNE